MHHLERPDTIMRVIGIGLANTPARSVEFLRYLLKCLIYILLNQNREVTSFTNRYERANYLVVGAIALTFVMS